MEIKIEVNFAAKWTPITIPADSTVLYLKSIVQPLTKPLVGELRIAINEGEYLKNDMKLQEAGVVDGSRVWVFVEPEELSVSWWEVTGDIGLSGCQLKAIPKEVWKFDPKSLDLSRNSIQKVPNEINRLTNLMKLLLDGNGLTDECIDWDGLRSLQCLKFLSLSENLLLTLPPALGTLTSLEQLIISYNRLDFLPKEIGGLISLKILKANYNRLTSLPPALGALTSLEELIISDNDIRTLPEEIRCLVKLEILEANFNRLISLPPELGALKSLRHLDIAFNYVKTLPQEIGQLASLEILDAAQNRLFSIPQCIGDCCKIKEVDFSINPLSEIPETFSNMRQLSELRLNEIRQLRTLPRLLFENCRKLSVLELLYTEITDEALNQYEGYEKFKGKVYLPRPKAT